MQAKKNEAESDPTDMSMKLDGTTVDELVLGMLWRP